MGRPDDISAILAALMNNEYGWELQSPSDSNLDLRVATDQLLRHIAPLRFEKTEDEI